MKKFSIAELDRLIRSGLTPADVAKRQREIGIDRGRGRPSTGASTETVAKARKAAELKRRGMNNAAISLYLNVTEARVGQLIKLAIKETGFRAMLPEKTG